MQFTAIIEKGNSGWYVGQIAEVPAVLAQGKSLKELKENLIDALQLVFETNRATLNAEYEGRTIIKEVIALPE